MSVNKYRAQLIKATVFALSVTLLLSGCAQTVPTQQEKPFLVSKSTAAPSWENPETVSVEKGDFITTASGTASLVFPMSTELTWTGGTARFRSAEVSQKQEVKKGDILMTFDVESSNADIAALRAQWNQIYDGLSAGKAERLAAIENAKSQTAALSSYDLQIANLTIEKMQAEYDEYVYSTNLKLYDVEKRIAKLEEITENNVLVAPFDGVIDSVTKFNLGDPIPSGKALITMHSTEQILLKISDSRLRYNMPITIECGAETFSGRVVAANNILPNELNQDLILVRLDENISEDKLRGTIKFQTNLEEVNNVLVVSKNAVNREQGIFYVYVPDGEDVQKKHIIARTNVSDTAWILDGLSEGQTLVVD